MNYDKSIDGVTSPAGEWQGFFHSARFAAAKRQSSCFPWSRACDAEVSICSPRRRSGILYFTSLAAVDDQQPISNDSTPATAKPDGAAGDQSVASLAAEPTHGTLHDRAFDKYVDSDFIAQAWNRLDADALTDVALQLAEGERILLRSHKVGSAADVLRLASRIATTRGNKETLASITTAAKALKVEDVHAQVAAASKLGGASRAGMRRRDRPDR